MKIIKLFLPGRFEDAYLYKERLLILTEGRTLRVYHLKHLLDNLENKYPDLAPVIAMMFANNNWQQDRLFKSFLKNPNIADIMSRIFEKFPQPHLEVQEIDALQTEEEVKITGPTLLDLLAYNQRLYIGASSGFYHLDVDWTVNKTGRNGDTFIKGMPVRRIDARCVNTLAGFGSINASCGNEGLFVALDEFRWIDKDKNYLPELKQQDSRSLRTLWSDYNLVNYSSYEDPLYLGNGYKRLATGGGIERERRVITSIGEKSYQIGSLFNHIRQKYDIEQSSIQYSYNTNNTFFVHTYYGNFYSASITFPIDRDPEIRRKKTFKGKESRILSAHPLDLGTVIETDDDIFLFANEEWFHIHESEALSIRTFPRSEPYQNITAITLEDGLLLVSVFDDEKILQDRTGSISWAP